MKITEKQAKLVAESCIAGLVDDLSENLIDADSIIGTAELIKVFQAVSDQQSLVRAMREWQGYAADDDETDEEIAEEILIALAEADEEVS